MIKSHLIMFCFALWSLLAGAAIAAPAVALYYGANPPLDELKAFDVVVVDPDQPGVDPSLASAGSQLFAYVSVGEVVTSRPYYAQIPPAWLHGENANWGSKLIDQSNPAWPQFFADKVVAPLWQRGFHGFFLDTLDSYQLLTQSTQERQRQEAGIITLIHTLKQRWPDIKLICNRGFNILPAVHQDIWMVAAESLFRSWDPASKRFVAVNASDHDWLLQQLHQVQQNYGLPVLVIDYVPEDARQLARDTATQIRAAGFIPYVTTPNVDMVGVGEVEVLPRKVLVIYDKHDAEDLFYADPVRFLGMPFAYLGLVPEYRPVNGDLPDYPLTGRYVGIVSWLNSDEMDRNHYSTWLQKQVKLHVPVAIFSHLGFGQDQSALATLGLNYIDGALPQGLAITHHEADVGFELPLTVKPEQLQPIGLSGSGQPWLSIAAGSAPALVPVAITPWGGYALDPYVIGELGSLDSSERWYINPLPFLRAALRLDASVPVPDVTTEMGRRLLMVHIDGDGFPSRAERPGYPLAGQVLLDDVLKRYQIPTTLSIIEGEVGPAGLYPEQSPAMEAVARQAFALPWVEIASHTYSHPFHWSEAQAKAMAIARHIKPSTDVDNLPIKGYVLNVDREVTGAANYINSQLAPPGKKVKVLLWPGDCVATPEALALSYRDGLLNMNGGDTIITKSRNSWTDIAGLGLERNGFYQVFAPDENENVYTNLWTGPFYGYERVIETFSMTGEPYRFKPIDIYFHPYAVTKTASLNALFKVYDWALQQHTNPVFTSEYIYKVLDFNHVVVARTPHGFRVRGNGSLRTVRLPADGVTVDLTRSRGVAGVAPGPNARYVNLVDGNAELVMSPQPQPVPSIESANARLTDFSRSASGLQFSLQSHVPLQMTLDDAQSCQLFANGSTLQPVRRNGSHTDYELNAHDQLAFRLACGA